MKEILFTLFYILFVPLLIANNYPDLTNLDIAIGNKALIIGQKERKIDSLRKLAYSSDISLADRYYINKKIYEEYEFYQYDSAVHYILMNKDISASLPLNYLNESNIEISALFSLSGYCDKAINVLNDIDRNTLDKPFLLKYYKSYEKAYKTAIMFEDDSLLIKHYKRKEALYLDSIFLLQPQSSYEYDYYKARKEMNNGDLKNAITLLLSVYDNVKDDTKLYSVITYNIAQIYKEMGNNKLYMKFLVLSALSEQRSLNRKNDAVFELALYLYNLGKMDIAYNYLKFVMSDVDIYNNPLYTKKTLAYLPDISQIYEKDTNRNRILVYLITIIGIILSSFVLYLYYKEKRKNTVLNNTLPKVRQETDHIRELFDEERKEKHRVSSQLVDLVFLHLRKNLSYKKYVRDKVSKKLFNDLKINNSTEIEINEFFGTFDKAFLRLYPDFVSEFNKLLVEDHFKLEEGELNTELRIFALMKLGVTDGAKIANFLGCNLQTVYNYRTKIKAKAKGNKDDFEKNVLDIR